MIAENKERYTNKLRNKLNNPSKIPEALGKF